VTGSPVPLLASHKTNHCHIKPEMHGNEYQTIVGATVFHTVSTMYLCTAHCEKRYLGFEFLVFCPLRVSVAQLFS